MSKLSQLENTTILSDDDLFYIVDGTPTSKGITKADLKTALGVPPQVSRIISGGMVNTTGLTYISANLVYEINGTQFAISDGTSITLDVAPTTATFQRIDLIYGKFDGTLSVSKGTESATPTANTLSFDELQLTLVLIDTNATTPSGVSSVLLYAENVGPATEATATESTGGARIDLASTNNPISGTVSIKTLTPLLGGDRITITFNDEVFLQDFSFIEFDIKPETIQDFTALQISLYNNGVSVGNFPSSNFVSDGTTNVRNVKLLKSDLSSNGVSVFDELRFSCINRVGTFDDIHFTLDNIYVRLDTVNTTQLDPTKSTVITDTNVTGTYEIDWNKDTYVLTLTGATVFSYSNLPPDVNANKRTLTLWITGEFTFILLTTDLEGSAGYDGAVTNSIVLECLEQATPIIRGQLTARST